MARTANIQVRVEPGIKSEVERILKAIGISTSEAFNLFMRQIIMEKGIPFKLSVPNEETMRSLDNIVNGQNLSKEYVDVEDMLSDLKTDD